MHFPRTVHTTAFDKPVVDHWLEQKIAQTAAGSTEDRSDDRPLQRRAEFKTTKIIIHTFKHYDYHYHYVCRFSPTYVFFLNVQLSVTVSNKLILRNCFSSWISCADGGEICNTLHGNLVSDFL